MNQSPASSTGGAKPPTRRAMAKQRTRQRLLGAAKRLFAERGYEAATVRDIAAAADLSTGAVFASFTDKAELFNEVILADYEALVRMMREASNEGSTRASLLKLFTLAYSLHIDELRLMQAAIGFSWLRDPQAERRARESARMIQAELEGILQRGVESGELSRSTDVSLTVEMLWASYVANYRQAIYDGWDVGALRTKFSAQIDLLLVEARAAA